jgi:hypothetical protein
MRKRTAAIGSAVMFIVGPGLVTGVVPWLLTRWQFREPTPYWAIFRVLGVLLILAGLVGLIQAFLRFVTESVGTRFRLPLQSIWSSAGYTDGYAIPCMSRRSR